MVVESDSVRVELQRNYQTKLDFRKRYQSFLYDINPQAAGMRGVADGSPAPRVTLEIAKNGLDYLERVASWAVQQARSLGFGNSISVTTALMGDNLSLYTLSNGKIYSLSENRKLASLVAAEYLGQLPQDEQDTIKQGWVEEGINSLIGAKDIEIRQAETPDEYDDQTLAPDVEDIRQRKTLFTGMKKWEVVGLSASGNPILKFVYTTPNYTEREIEVNRRFVSTKPFAEWPGNDPIAKGDTVEIYGGFRRFYLRNSGYRHDDPFVLINEDDDTLYEVQRIRVSKIIPNLLAPSPELPRPVKIPAGLRLLDDWSGRETVAFRARRREMVEEARREDFATRARAVQSGDQKTALDINGRMAEEQLWWIGENVNNVLYANPNLNPAYIFPLDNPEGFILGLADGLGVPIPDDEGFDIERRVRLIAQVIDVYLQNIDNDSDARNVEDCSLGNRMVYDHLAQTLFKSGETSPHHFETLSQLIRFINEGPYWIKFKRLPITPLTEEEKLAADPPFTPLSSNKINIERYLRDLAQTRKHDLLDDPTAIAQKNARDERLQNEILIPLIQADESAVTERNKLGQQREDLESQAVVFVHAERLFTRLFAQPSISNEVRIAYTNLCAAQRNIQMLKGNPSLTVLQAHHALHEELQRSAGVDVERIAELQDIANLRYREFARILANNPVPDADDLFIVYMRLNRAEIAHLKAVVDAFRKERVYLATIAEGCGMKLITRTGRVDDIVRKGIAERTQEKLKRSLDRFRKWGQKTGEKVVTLNKEPKQPQFDLQSDIARQEIYLLYEHFFRRDPDPGGLENYMRRLRKEGGSLGQIRQELAGSDEYRERLRKIAAERGQATAIETLYREVFDREIDDSGRANYIDRNIDPGQVLIEMLNSDEFREKFLKRVEDTDA